jgi:hypothetical protein
MEQLIIHGLADFFFTQGSYQAVNKNKNTRLAFLHAFLYTLCFLILTLSWKALLVIGITHFLIDRFSLPKYCIFVKEWIFNPQSWRATWASSNHNGYFDHVGDEWGEQNMDKIRPPFISWWLYIITDNLFHLSINFLALKYLS